MEQNGLIRPSASPWSCGIVLVPKPDGSMRFCCDYRRLNTVTKKDVFPLPLIQEVIDALTGTEIFTTLDLAHGFWQIPIAEESKEKSAFITPWGLYEWNVMPFGLCNAPSTFQRCLNFILTGMRHINILCYIDDLIIYSKTWDEHKEALKELFGRLRESNLKVKGTKCQFARGEITYLGHVVSREGVKIDTSQLSVIKDYPSPTTVKEIQKAMGLFNYYRKWIPKFSYLAKPIVELLKKENEFVWNDLRESHFRS
jgi:Reverse transcriptase (RNA-dependent DNA polymerase)